MNLSPSTASAELSTAAVSVVLPCLNEARTVAVCVREALAALARLGRDGEVIVCDNGSTDGSQSLAEAAGARVVDCSQRGYGHAVRTGVAAARGDWIVMADADGSYDLHEIGALIDELAGGAQLVLGDRFRGKIERGAMPWKNRYIGNPVLTRTLNLLFGAGVGDAHCGLRGFTREAFDRMRPESAGMELASEMVVKAKLLELPTAQVGVTLRPDGRGGRRPHLAPWRDGWRHLKFLLMFSPSYLFAAPGAILALAGLALVLILAWGPVHVGRARLDVHWMAAGLLAALLGFQLIEFGLAARLYTVTHRFPHRDRLLEWLRKRVRLEHGLLVGGTMFVAGLGLDVWIVVEWIAGGFGALARVRTAILATALAALGAQTVFFSFFAAIVGERRP